MAKKLTEEQFKNKLFEIHRGEVELVSAYTNSRDKLQFSHKQYGTWSAIAANVLRGSSHPESGKDKGIETCIAKYGVSHATQSIEVKNKIKATNMDRYGGTYPSYSEEVRNKTKETNIEKYGAECVFASEEIKKKIHNAQVLNRESTRKKRAETNLERYGSVSPLGSLDVRNKASQTLYQNFGKDGYDSEIIKTKRALTNLQKYGHENVFSSSAVKACIFETRKSNGSHKESSIEKEILSFVKETDPLAEKAIMLNRKGEPWEFDIVSEKHKIAIEVNGGYWHSTDRKGTRHHPKTHLLKSKIAESNGYSLIHIWDSEWIYKKEKIQNYLSSKLARCSVKVFARKCEIRIVDRQTAKPFLQANHILGDSIGSYFGLFHKDLLVSLITVRKHHRNGKDLVVSRFCSLPGYSVAGGLGKLSKHCSNVFKQDLVSWKEIRLGKSEAYIKSGWVIDSVSEPDYFYYRPRDGSIVSKQSRKRSKVNTLPGVTEHQHALEDGLYRVWDCGKIRYKYVYV